MKSWKIFLPLALACYPALALAAPHPTHPHVRRLPAQLRTRNPSTAKAVSRRSSHRPDGQQARARGHRRARQVAEPVALHRAAYVHSAGHVPLRVGAREVRHNPTPPARIVAAREPAVPAPSASFADDQAFEAREPVHEGTLLSHFASLFAPLRGSHESLVRQNERSQQDGSERIETEQDIQRQVAEHTLVPLPAAAHLAVDPRLPEDRRYTRAWTAHFLRDMAAAFGMQFGTTLQINSAVRTAEFQRRLIHINGNAAAVDGEAASPHLYGGAVDIGKGGMSAQEINWVRGYLRPLVDAGKIDVAEEFKQACFHISVYKNYVTADREEVARVHTAANAPGR